MDGALARGVAGVNFANGETVTRLRAVLIADPYSTDDTQAAWDDTDNPPDALEIDGCGFNPGSSTEPLQDARNAVVTRPEVYAPSGADVLAGDRLVVRGDTYEVFGNPGDYRSPFTGWAPGLAIPLQRVEG